MKKTNGFSRDQILVSECISQRERKHPISILAAALLLGIVVLPKVQAQTINNGTFNISPLSTSPTASGWAVDTEGGTYFGNLYFSTKGDTITSPPAGDTYVAFFDAPIFSDEISQTPNLGPGTYTIDFSLDLVGSGSMNVNFGGPGGTSESFSSATSGWVPESITYTVPAGPTVPVVLTFDGAANAIGADEAGIDDVRFAPAGAGVPDNSATLGLLGAVFAGLVALRKRVPRLQPCLKNSP